MDKPVKITQLASRMVELSGQKLRDENNPEGDIEMKIIGLRPGEKMHETLIPEDESRNVLEFESHYVIQPIQSFWGNKIGILGGVSCSDGFQYASNCNCENLTPEDLKELLIDFLPSSATPS